MGIPANFLAVFKKYKGKKGICYKQNTCKQQIFRIVWAENSDHFSETYTGLKKQLFMKDVKTLFDVCLLYFKMTNLKFRSMEGGISFIKREMFVH